MKQFHFKTYLSYFKECDLIKIKSEHSVMISNLFLQNMPIEIISQKNVYFEHRNVHYERQNTVVTIF